MAEELPIITEVSELTRARNVAAQLAEGMTESLQQMSQHQLPAKVIIKELKETAAVLYHAMCMPLHLQMGELLDRMEALEAKAEALEAEVGSLKAKVQALQNGQSPDPFAETHSS